MAEKKEKLSAASSFFFALYGILGVIEIINKCSTGWTIFVLVVYLLYNIVFSGINFFIVFKNDGELDVFLTMNTTCLGLMYSLVWLSVNTTTFALISTLWTIANFSIYFFKNGDYTIDDTPRKLVVFSMLLEVIFLVTLIFGCD